MRNLIATVFLLLGSAVPVFAQSKDPFCQAHETKHRKRHQDACSVCDYSNGTTSVANEVLCRDFYRKPFNLGEVWYKHGGVYWNPGTNTNFFNDSARSKLMQIVHGECVANGLFQVVLPKAADSKQEPGTEQQPPAGGDAVDAVAVERKRKADATDEAYRLARMSEDEEIAYDCKISDKLGVPICVDLYLAGPMVSVSSAGASFGGMVALHVPFRRLYRSGFEVGVHGGYAGHEDEPGILPDLPKAHFFGQVGPLAQGVVMPWRWFGIVIGMQADFRLPTEETDPSYALWGRLALRAYPSPRVAVEGGILGGGVTDDGDEWSQSGGLFFSLLYHP